MVYRSLSQDIRVNDQAIVTPPLEALAGGIAVMMAYRLERAVKHQDVSDLSHIMTHNREAFWIDLKDRLLTDWTSESQLKKGELQKFVTLHEQTTNFIGLMPSWFELCDIAVSKVRPRSFGLEAIAIQGKPDSPFKHLYVVAVAGADDPQTGIVAAKALADHSFAVRGVSRALIQRITRKRQRLVADLVMDAPEDKTILIAAHSTGALEAAHATNKGLKNAKKVEHLVLLNPLVAQGLGKGSRAARAAKKAKLNTLMITSHPKDDEMHRLAWSDFEQMVNGLFRNFDYPDAGVISFRDPSIKNFVDGHSIALSLMALLRTSLVDKRDLVHIPALEARALMQKKRKPAASVRADFIAQAATEDWAKADWQLEGRAEQRLEELFP